MLSLSAENTVYLSHQTFITSFVPDHTKKCFFIFRDPRDQVVSMAFWVKKNPKIWPLHSSYSIEELIQELIIDGSSIYSHTMCFYGKRKVCGISELYKAFLPWVTLPGVCILRFESMVGNRGGGLDSLQINEIERISSFLDIKLSNAEILNISKTLFGGTSTFKTGQIGTWREYFSEKHINLFKEHAGDVLIKLGYENSLNW